jgi:16S rRNA (guanine966-N2)-methyltransferase
MALIQGKIRIIGGEWRRRSISFPDLADLRPTPDRVRETVFNWLGQDLGNKACLDLFAGSGAMGFEAASRGAKHVVMVESKPTIVSALQGNVKKLKATQVELIRMDAVAFIMSNSRQFDVIFIDPPYRLGLTPKLLTLLPPHLTKDGVVYVEGENYISPDETWHVWRSKQAGKVFFQLLKLS